MEEEGARCGRVGSRLRYCAAACATLQALAQPRLGPASRHRRCPPNCAASGKPIARGRRRAVHTQRARWQRALAHGARTRVGRVSKVVRHIAQVGCDGREVVLDDAGARVPDEDPQRLTRWGRAASASKSLGTVGSAVQQHALSPRAGGKPCSPNATRRPRASHRPGTHSPFAHWVTEQLYPTPMIGAQTPFGWPR